MLDPAAKPRHFDFSGGEQFRVALALAPFSIAASAARRDADRRRLAR
jgi:hypothetical protein